MSNGKQPRLVAKHHEVAAIYSKLKEVCTLKDGIAEYAEGWDDERVRKEVAPRLLAAHVGRMRTDAIGPLKRADAGSDMRASVERQGRLIEALFAKLEMNPADVV